VATLDVLSDGRAEVGVGRGIHQGIYEVMGRPPEQAGDILEEGMELLHRLLTEERVSWAGEWRGQIEDITIRPRPIQPSIPLWSGSTSAPELCARLGLPCMWVATVYPHAKLIPLAERYRADWLAAGRGLDSFQLGIGVHCHLARTSQQARDRFRPHFGHYFASSAAIEKSNLKRAVQPTARDMSLFDTVPFVGSPQEIVDKVGIARDDLGLTRMALVIDMGGIDQEIVLEQIAMLGDEVLPAFR
jgi:alkanesulfonate monooxygenase SsuD/methylene tetrahydromethanopterin reductase-like flavin-dependent oxidoreductase (luciferase family)